MSAIQDRHQAVRQAHAEGRIVYVTRPEPIVPEARAVHDYLSDSAIPELERMRIRQMVMMLLGMARGERGA